MKLYTPLIDKTMQIAYDAHHGQVDKGKGYDELCPERASAQLGGV
jgi:hypothetical protein